MTLKKQHTYQQLWGVSIMVAPLLLAISTFFWENEEYGVTGGTILVLSMVFYVPAFFNISHDAYIQGFSKYPVSAKLLLFWSGPLFPLSMLVLSILLIRTKSVPVWAGLLLCLGAIGFPLSRISRIVLIAHLDDFLVLIPLVYLSWAFLVAREPDMEQHRIKNIE